MDAIQRNNLQVSDFTLNRVDTALTTSAQTLLTAPSSGYYEIVGLWFNEYSNNADTVTAYRVPTGGALADTNSLCKAEAISAKGRLTLADKNLSLVLKDGDFIQALAGSNSRVMAHVEYRVFR